MRSVGDKKITQVAVTVFVTVFVTIIVSVKKTLKKLWYTKKYV